MTFSLSRIGQIALAVKDVDSAETFYRDVLRLRWLYRFGDLTFFDLQRRSAAPGKGRGCGKIVARLRDLFHLRRHRSLVRELEQRRVTFSIGPRLIAPMDDHDLWMAFFEDPDGHTLALMQEAPKGYVPASA